MEKVIFVVGSNQSSGFYVVDFSNAPGQIPPPVQVATSGGCVVECSEKLAAVGNCSGNGSVTIYDVSTPASPKAIGSTPVLSSVIAIPGYAPVRADLQGIGSISFYGGYVLVGEASNAVVDNFQVGGRVALIDISNLANPQVYGTGLSTVTGVTIFGEYAIICGTTAGFYNAFLVANLATNPVSLGPATNFGAQRGGPTDPNPIRLPIIVQCDFDGTHAVFSDERGYYVCRISNGVPASAPTGGGGTGPQSISIAEGTGGYQLATAGTGPAINVNGDALGGQSFESGWATRFSRSITGTSTQLGAMCYTTSGQYVVAYFNLTPGSGWTEQGQAPVALAPGHLPNPPAFSDYTLGIATYYVFPFPPPVKPVKL